MSKGPCIISVCDKEIYSNNMCHNHLYSWRTYGDAMEVSRRKAAAKAKPKPITVKNLKELGLYSPFDVSRWCAQHGLQSVYLENHTERIMDVDWTYMAQPCWVVRDAKQPGKILKKFVLRSESSAGEVRKNAEAWVEANFNTPMKYMDSMKSSFPDGAVDLLLNEIEILRRVWNPVEPERNLVDVKQGTTTTNTPSKAKVSH